VCCLSLFEVFRGSDPSGGGRHSSYSVKRSSNTPSQRKQLNCRGTSIVEFGLILPILFLIIGGFLDWSLLFFSKHIALNAAREGARVAATTTELMLPVPDADVAKGNIINNTILPLLFQSSLFTCANIAIVGPGCFAAEGSIRNMVEVTVSCTYNFSLLSAFGFGTSQIDQSSIMLYEPLSHQLAPGDCIAGFP